MLPEAVREFLRRDVLDRFTRYVRIDTTPDPTSDTDPSTERQFDLLRLLERECRALGLADVDLSDTGYVYATLPAREGVTAEPFALLAHVDTSPEQPGHGVEPVLHEGWDGSPIRFPHDPDLVLTPDDSPELERFTGDTIITASGRTLLGADDKAGVAEIMAAMAALVRFDELPHGEIRVCFTSDEEIGRGTRGLDLSRLPRYGYTIDGSVPGELEDECFDAHKADIVFHGIGVHPGFAKGKMVHAAMEAARFLAALPEQDSPAHTEGREGFTYLVRFEGDVNTARLELMLRDFERENNERRMERLRSLADAFRRREPRLGIEITFTEQYRNMRDVLAEHPHVVERAAAAIEDAGLPLVRHAIRGGTDGSLLSQLGHPTPNIFAGGMLFHSRKEWVALGAMEKAAETIVHLARRWIDSAD